MLSDVNGKVGNVVSRAGRDFSFLKCDFDFATLPPDVVRQRLYFWHLQCDSDFATTTFFPWCEFAKSEGKL